MDKKKIKVLIVKSSHSISKIIENIWEKSKNKLNKLGYSIEYHYDSYKNIQDNNWLNKRLNDIKEKKLDIILWPFFVSNFNYDNVFFSDSILMEKQLILYEKDFKIKGIEMYYIDLFKFWIPFIIILIIFSLIMTIIYSIFFYQGSTFKKNYFRFFHSSLLSNKNLYLFNKKNNMYVFIYFLFCSVIFYIAYIFLHSITSAKSILYSSPNKEIYESIKGTVLLVNKYDIMNIHKIKSQGGIVKKSDKQGIELLNQFLDGSNKYDGIIVHSIDLNNYYFDGDTIYVSEINKKFDITKQILGYNELCLPINIDKKDLQNLINQEIKRTRENYKDILCKGKNIDGHYNSKGFYVNIPCLI